MQESLANNLTIHISSKTHLNLTFNLCQCGVNELLPGGRLSVGSSDTFTVMVVGQGAGLLETNSLAFRFAESQGLFCFPDEAYELQNLGGDPLQVTWLCFTGYLVENYLNRANIFRSKPVFADGERQVAEKMNRLYAVSQQMPNRYCKMVSIVYDIFSYLLDANPTKNLDGYVDNMAFYAAKAVDYIDRNYAKSLSVDEIAAALGISRKHLYTVFNSTLKISPKQYIIYYRTEKACARLKSTSQSIQEVAESVGYANQFYFAKEFKRLIGTTPSSYRKDPVAVNADIFAYRSFAATLKEKLEDHSMDLPQDERLISIYLPPQPADRSRH